MRLSSCLVVAYLLAVNGVEVEEEVPSSPPDQQPAAEHWWQQPAPGGHFAPKGAQHRHHHHSLHELFEHEPVGDHRSLPYPHHPLPPPPPASAAMRGGTITVTGEGAVMADPDSAVVSVSVSQVADRPLKAKEMLHDKLSKVQDALGMGEEVLTIKPERYRVNKNYKWGSDGTRKLEGYEASQELRFSVWDLEQLDTLVDKLLEFDDLTDVRNIDLQVKEPRAALEKAREIAVMDTQRKAEQILASYGRALGPVLKVEENRDVFVSPIMERMAVSAKSDSAGPTYQGKPVDFHYTLTTTFAIGRPIPQPRCGGGEGGMMCDETPATA